MTPRGAEHQTPTLFIDIDGVLLGKGDPGDSAIVLAKHAGAFLEFAVEHFMCFWLSTHTQNGDRSGARKVLAAHADSHVMDIVDKIPAAAWTTLKTEALDLKSDFYWIDDGPLATEIDFLKQAGVIERLILVDTRKYPDDLERVTGLLSAISQKRGLKTA